MKNIKIAVHDPKLRELVYDRFLELGAKRYALSKEYLLKDPWLLIDENGFLDGYGYPDGYEECEYREITLDELFGKSFEKASATIVGLNGKNQTATIDDWKEIREEVVAYLDRIDSELVDAGVKNVRRIFYVDVP